MAGKSAARDTCARIVCISHPYADSVRAGITYGIGICIAAFIAAGTRFGADGKWKGRQFFCRTGLCGILQNFVYEIDGIFRKYFSFFYCSFIKNFAVGMIVDLYDDEDALVSAGHTVTGVNYSKKQITLTGTAQLDAVGGSIYMQNSRNLEITGLGAIFSDSTELYGLKRADNPWLNPVKVSTVGTLTENAVQKAIDLVEENAGSKINFIVCSWGVRRALYEVLSGYRQVDSVELAGGAKAITFNGIPVVADRFCPDGTMYLLNTDDFRLHQLCDWQWLEGENGRILAQVPGKPVYTATLVKYAELMCSRPCGQAVLTGITEK